ncbi:sensor domain-containing diguanylate cyclase [Aliidiomarina sp. Khilg15.8]
MDKQLELLARSVSHSDDLESLTRPMLELIQRGSGLESVYLTLIDKAGGRQQVLFAENAGTLQIPEGLSVPWEDTLCKRALDEGRYVTDDVPGCWGDSEAARELGLQTYASVPVKLGDSSLFGTLCGASSQPLNVNENSVNVLHLCAGLIAHYLDRQQRVQAAEQRADDAESRLNQVELMTRISRVCLAARHLPDALAEVIRLFTAQVNWKSLEAFSVQGNEVKALGKSSASSLQLIKDLIVNDAAPIELIVRNQLEPLLWAEAESDKIAAIITSDDALQAVLLIHMSEDSQTCSEQMQLLNNTTNALSLLAARLADHERLEAANQVLEHRALHDVLTGLPNRRYLIEALDNRLEEAERLGSLVYIAFIDLDDFKKLNDAHGHDVGDDFLEAFARRLSAVLRGHDLVARYGGDEFVFVGQGSPDDDLERVKQQISTRIRNATSGRFLLPTTEIDYAGPSIGIVEWQPGQVRDADIMLSHADSAMYEDKKRRRGKGSD